MLRRIPFPSLAVIQFIPLMALPFLIVPFALNMDFPMLTIPLALAVVWVADAAIFVLSFIFWWNRPLQISQEGIKRRREPLCRYEDAVAFSFKKGFPIYYGRTPTRLTILYKNGISISFECDEPILKTINSLCKDKAFLIKFNESSKQ